MMSRDASNMLTSVTVHSPAYPPRESLWRERALVPSGGTPWWDKLLVATLMFTAIAEVALDAAVLFKPAMYLVAPALTLTILFRRRHALAAFLVGFGVSNGLDLIAFWQRETWRGPKTWAFVLLLFYSLFRWGSGRQVAGGLAVMSLGYLNILTTGEVKNVVEGVAAAIVMLFPAIVAVSVRLRASAQKNELETVRLGERARLARELHDTVAHHISAIVVQAQAGQAVAVARPAAAVETLMVIERAARQTLREMRSLVGVLREEGIGPLAPLSGIEDIAALAETQKNPGAIAVEIDIDVNPNNFAPLVQTALYRIAQESITNAQRHAKNASHVSVRLFSDGEGVKIEVTDDGDPIAKLNDAARGFGLVGMQERATMLGGKLRAGPGPSRGWAVCATLPAQEGES